MEGAEEAGGRRPNRWLALAVVAGCFLPVAADATILNVAVPSLTGTLGATAREVLWIADVYPLMMVGLVLITGPLGDRIGHKRLLTLGLTVFAAASALCSLAGTPGVLIAGRAVLAAGASMIIPATLAIIRQTFHDERQRATAIGVWSAVAAGGAAVGPVVGGLLLERYWWGSVFLINIPVVAAVLAFVAVRLVNRTAGEDEPWELTSPLLAVIGAVGTVYAVKTATRPEAPLVEAVLPGALGLTAAALFVRRQLAAAHPMLDLSLFRQRPFRAAVVAATVPVLVLVGMELQLAQYLQFVLGMSPQRAAVFLLPMPVAAFAAGPLAGFCVHRFGAVAVIPAGLAMAAIGYTGIGLTAAGSGTDGPGTVVLTGCLVLIGAGHGAVQTVASDAIMTGAPEERAGAAAAVESVAYELGAGFGIALLGSLTTTLYGHAFAPPAALAASVPPGATESIGQAVEAAGTLDGPSAEAVVRTAGTAFADAYQTVNAVAAVLVTAVAVATAVALRPARPDRPDRTGGERIPVG
ncbi:MFS transporter [Kitasatospora sp. NPDC093806]|uniref:MFS transporter n=1 Tax=Kitasatospora sp. NPDC093806 TaxID=3155075 RepID=UPI00342720A5